MSSITNKSPSNALSRKQSTNTSQNGTKLIPLKTGPSASIKSAFHKKDFIPNQTITSSFAQNHRKNIIFSDKVNQSNVRAHTEASPTKTSQIVSSSMQSNGFSVSDFVNYIHKKRVENMEDPNKSFISFRNLANGDPPHAGGGEYGEVFMSPSQADHWKKQLNLNKQRETLFKKTIQDIFVQSKQNFYKLCETKDKKMQKMPRVKIYTTTNSFRSERNKISFLEPIPAENVTEDKNQDKVSEYSSRVYISKNEPYRFHLSTQGDPVMRKPNAREGATLTVVGKNVYLYGGVAREVYNEWEMLDTTTFTWTKMQVKGDIPSYGRYGHSADRYMNSIIVFGGEKNYNTILKIRECVSDVRLFIPENNEWKYLKCQGEFIEPRRNHIGVVVGKHLLIHGGIDTSGTYLSDVKVLNLLNNKWSSVEERGAEPIAVAFHKACAVIAHQRKDLNLFRFPDIRTDDSSHSKIKEEGIYFFGGKTAEGEVLDTLRILKIGTSIFKWITPETLGRSADARFLHTMVHCRKLNSLIVHGGRCDGYMTERKSPFLGDFHLLQLDNLTWVSVVVGGSSSDPRCSHSAAVLGSKIIIFGGIHYSTYCPPEHQVYEVDPAIIRNLERKVEVKKSLGQQDLAPKIDLLHSRPPRSNLGTIVSWLPLPNTEDTPKKLRQLTRKEALDKVLGQNKHYEDNDF